MHRAIQIAICEDDKTQQDYIASLVKDWAEKENQVCRIESYDSAEQLIYSFDKDFPFSVYILDIQMGGMDGMELARRIRRKDSQAVILFLTGLRDYVLEGYEVGAMRYLMKPINEEEFYRILCQIERERLVEAETYFVLERQEEVLKIPYRDIWYLEAQGHYVEMHYGEEVLRWKSGIGKLQQEFGENGFVMVRRGTLVNLGRVAKVGKTECILDNGEAIPVSRSQYRKVNEAFIGYYRTRKG